MLGSLLCDAIAAKREDIFKAAIDGRSRAAWASLASPTCHRNGPGSAKCSVFPRTDPVSLAFCRVTQDGDDEGCLHLDRLPTAAEAELIREAVGIRKRLHHSRRGLHHVLIEIRQDSRGSTYPFPPKVFEPHRRQVGVAHCVLNVFLPQVCLQRPGIVTTVRQRIAAGMSEHVRVRLEAELGLDTCSFDHPGEAGRGERCSAF